MATTRWRLMVVLVFAAAGACSSSSNGTGTGGSGGSTGGSAGGSSGGTGGRAGSGGATGGSGGITDGGVSALATSDGTWFIIGGGADAAADAAVNPAANVAGTVQAFADGAGTRLVLSVTGVTPSRGFGAHLHSTNCATGDGGPHYRNDGDAGATPTNEAWLDFTSTTAGAGMSTTTVTWRPTAGMKAVVIHDMLTVEGGAAGPRLACTNITFP